GPAAKSGPFSWKREPGTFTCVLKMKTIRALTSISSAKSPFEKSRLESRLQAVGAWNRLKAGLQTRRTYIREIFQTRSKPFSVPLPSLLAFLLILLLETGCDRRPSTLPNERSNSSSVASKKELVPLTNMVFIKAGTFARLKHSVTLTRDFWLGKY